MPSEFLGSSRQFTGDDEREMSDPPEVQADGWRERTPAEVFEVFVKALRQRQQRIEAIVVDESEIPF